MLDTAFSGDSLFTAHMWVAFFALAAFPWSLKSGQYDDLDGAAERILDNDGKSFAGR